MATALILVIEDEPNVRQMLRLLLQRSGYQVEEAADAGEAKARLTQNPPALILLDWMLPGMSGVELARSLKQSAATRDIPVIMLTARGEENDKVQGLESGADDYITKPFSTRELLARIKARLRRASPTVDESLLELGGLCLDPASHRVSTRGLPVELGPTEYKLLHFFMSHPDRVYSRVQLLDRVWGTNVFIEERTVDVHIRRLRKALEPGGHDRLLQTVRGAGYRFSLQD